jgi:hypothetical protein
MVLMNLHFSLVQFLPICEKIPRNVINLFLQVRPCRSKIRQLVDRLENISSMRCNGGLQQ